MIYIFSISIFNIILNLVYVISALYFLFVDKNMLSVNLSIMCIIISLLLEFLRRKSIFKTTRLFVILSLFVFFSSFLGGCFGLYDLINNYDDFLHIWSGFIGVAFGVNVLLVTNKDDFILSKSFIIIYLFMFSMAIAGLWEIAEFIMDNTLRLNTQSGGLHDTMTDMIDGLIGAIIFIIFYLKRGYDM